MNQYNQLPSIVNPSWKQTIIKKLNSKSFLSLFITLLISWCFVPGNATAIPRDRFDVNRHGFNFYNRNWKDICISLVGTKVRYVSDSSVDTCYDGWGLCGGMSLLAGERYMDGEESISLKKSDVKRAIVDAQMRTITGGIVSKWMSWISSPDEGHWHDASHSVGHRMKEDWNKSIRPRLDRGELVVIGLVRSKRATLVSGRQLGAAFDLAKQHAVLAIDYSKNGNIITIEAYDPNYPQKEIRLTFTKGRAGVNETFKNGNSINRKNSRGIMFIRGVPDCKRGKGWYVGDFNGDGMDDIFRYVNKYGGAEVMLSTGNGFSSPQRWSGAGDRGKGLHIGDFNGDGKDDVFRYLNKYGGAEVMLSTGNGFSSPQRWSGYGDRRKGWHIGDFNGDGMDDIFRYVNKYGGAEVMLSTGNGFGPPRRWCGAGDRGKGLHIGDFNGDGKDDVFRYLNKNGGAEVMLSTGSGFNSPQRWSGYGNRGQGWHIGDFNGDGKDDIFRYVNKYGQGAEVMLSSGRGFGSPQLWTNSHNWNSGWFIGNFNGDCTDDILRYQTKWGGAKVLWSTGTQFQRTQPSNKAIRLNQQCYKLEKKEKVLQQPGSYPNKQRQILRKRPPVRRHN